jgi:hypothetical protein
MGDGRRGNWETGSIAKGEATPTAPLTDQELGD